MVVCVCVCVCAFVCVCVCVCRSHFGSNHLWRTFVFKFVLNRSQALAHMRTPSRAIAYPSPGLRDLCSPPNLPSGTHHTSRAKQNPTKMASGAEIRFIMQEDTGKLKESLHKDLLRDLTNILTQAIDERLVKYQKDMDEKFER